MTVYLVSQAAKYHVDKTCQHIRDTDKEIREWSESLAESHGYGKCRKCSGEYDPTKVTQDRSIYQMAKNHE